MAKNMTSEQRIWLLVFAVFAQGWILRFVYDDVSIFLERLPKGRSDFWQRHMFEEPEPEVPEAIKDLLDPLDRENRFLANQHIIEAYRRGQQSKEVNDATQSRG